MCPQWHVALKSNTIGVKCLFFFFLRMITLDALIGAPNTLFPQGRIDCKEESKTQEFPRVWSQGELAHREAVEIT